VLVTDDRAPPAESCSIPSDTEGGVPNVPVAGLALLLSASTHSREYRLLGVISGPRALAPSETTGGWFIAKFTVVPVPPYSAFVGLVAATASRDSASLYSRMTSTEASLLLLAHAACPSSEGTNLCTTRTLELGPSSVIVSRTSRAVVLAFQARTTTVLPSFSSLASTTAAGPSWARLPTGLLSDALYVGTSAA